VLTKCLSAKCFSINRRRTVIMLTDALNKCCHCCECRYGRGHSGERLSGQCLFAKCLGAIEDLSLRFETSRFKMKPMIYFQEKRKIATYKCDRCPYSSLKKDEFTSHLKKVHGKPVLVRVRVTRFGHF